MQALLPASPKEISTSAPLKTGSTRKPGVLGVYCRWCSYRGGRRSAEAKGMEEPVDYRAASLGFHVRV